MKRNDASCFKGGLLLLAAHFLAEQCIYSQPLLPEANVKHFSEQVAAYQTQHERTKQNAQQQQRVKGGQRSRLAILFFIELAVQ